MNSTASGQLFQFDFSVRFYMLLAIGLFSLWHSTILHRLPGEIPVSGFPPKSEASLSYAVPPPPASGSPLPFRAHRGISKPDIFWKITEPIRFFTYNGTSGNPFQVSFFKHARNFSNPTKPAPLVEKQKAIPPFYEAVREVTAYNVGDSTQCEGDPCIAASGENICDAVNRGYQRAAANFVPLGTVIEVQHMGEFLVTDRMNPRYPDRVDIAMNVWERNKAKSFGVKRLKVRVVR